MPKPSEIITTVANLMNDASQSLYTNNACLSYLNLALDQLQELYEQNDIPTTHSTSSVITVPAGINRIGFDTTPALPSNLIEISQLWESQTNLNNFIPMNRRDYIPHYLQNQTLINQFLLWSWESQRIRLIAANAPNDLKIDYTCAIFNTPILIKDINVNLPFTNIKTYLEYKTGALCAMFMAENESRAIALNNLAEDALNRALQIPIKGQQNVLTRRRPFRYGLKSRNVVY